MSWKIGQTVHFASYKMVYPWIGEAYMRTDFYEGTVIGVDDKMVSISCGKSIYTATHDEIYDGYVEMRNKVVPKDCTNRDRLYTMQTYQDLGGSVSGDYSSPSSDSGSTSDTSSCCDSGSSCGSSE